LGYSASYASGDGGSYTVTIAQESATATESSSQPNGTGTQVLTVGDPTGATTPEPAWTPVAVGEVVFKRLAIVVDVAMVVSGDARQPLQPGELGAGVSRAQRAVGVPEHMRGTDSAGTPRRAYSGRTPSEHPPCA